METDRSAPVAATALDVEAENISLLVVDDDAGNREPLARRLQRRGYQVAVAADGPTALRQIEARKIDLVLLDVMMPGMSGLEVLETIRQSRSAIDLPVIMATAKDDSRDIVHALELGANDYVTKPLDFAVVLARLRTHLRLKRAMELVVSLEHRLIQRNGELESANSRLTQFNERTRRELETAAKVQAALLPESPPDIPGLQFAWAFEPCDELAGDSLNVFALDSTHAGFYVLDVSGHGVAASLLAVAATRLMSATDEPELTLVQSSERGVAAPADPAQVARRLSGRLSWHSTAEQFLTLFYAVLDSETRTLTYTSAGHPGAVRLSRGAAPSILEGSDLPIGVGDTYQQHSVVLSAGDRVYLYSDGITEAMNARRDLFGRERLLAALQRGFELDLRSSVSLILREVRDWRGGQAARDDMTLLAVECG